jgi:hypothetical protein
MTFYVVLGTVTHGSVLSFGFFAIGIWTFGFAMTGHGSLTIAGVALLILIMAWIDRLTGEWVFTTVSRSPLRNQLMPIAPGHGWLSRLAPVRVEGNWVPWLINAILTGVIAAGLMWTIARHQSRIESDKITTTFVVLAPLAFGFCRVCGHLMVAKPGVGVWARIHRRQPIVWRADQFWIVPLFNLFVCWGVGSLILWHEATPVVGVGLIFTLAIALNALMPPDRQTWATTGHAKIPISMPAQEQQLKQMARAGPEA